MILKYYIILPSQGQVSRYTPTPIPTSTPRGIFRIGVGVYPRGSGRCIPKPMLSKIA